MGRNKKPRFDWSQCKNAAEFGDALASMLSSGAMSEADQRAATLLAKVRGWVPSQERGVPDETLDRQPAAVGDINCEKEIPPRGWFFRKYDSGTEILTGPFGDDDFVAEIQRLLAAGHWSSLRPQASGEFLISIVMPNGRREYLDIRKKSLAAELRRMRDPAFTSEWA